MEGISISSERVVAAGSDIGVVGSRLAREIVTMGDLLAQIRGGWQSEQAAPRFAAHLQGYLDQATAMKDALVGQGESLVGAGHRFAEAETHLAAGMSGVR